MNAQLLTDMEVALELITGIRNLRSGKQISPKVELPLAINSVTPNRFKPLEGLIKKLANVVDIQYVNEKVAGLSFVIKGDEFYVNILGEIDVQQERANQQKELNYAIGFS